jgi:DNA polymerase-3 subunit epsilon
MARPEPLALRISEADVEAHRKFIDKLGDKAIWLRFWEAVSR